MAAAKKFGAFGGVFTPSILTILGVIMYMRLGWVVGQAGLIAALAIIFVAHIISVSTGLSIASVATDKKIKTGGIYYILSRSLGLPMGGAIGLTLFIGTAMSISLYLVGFAESFLSVDSIREGLGLAQDVNSYRIIGSLFLLILVIIAFISTSLAIKSQYFILAAIVLSLISIFVGFFIHPEFHPEQITLTPPEDAVSLALVFGIFFPAVTGFTAGVAMSGDLKDPRKAIPSGTIGSIAVGLIVYVSLAVGFAYFVKPDLLNNDVNFLMKVAWISPLVLAGIWGATLSSGLGGILGGPRILQAIAADKMAPKIFAKGYGASNEPRNALILTYLIAEGGILIGELNVIAGVVSMFYLASYGFINLAFFLEKWASTDFRPSFTVNRYVGLLGFIASFLVMSQLDMLSMFAALFIMFGLYLLLSRKQLQNDSGDVWQSVWLSVVRHALHRMDKAKIEERNWQPNILMFSGGTSRRPHIIEFGKSLVGKYGMLSNFDLYESKDKKYLFPKHLQSLPFEDINSKGVFTRRQTCSDIYRGIETIVSTYGFSGIEPNTALMGWARQSSDPKRFVEMIRRLYELDVNVLLIDYDKRYGYGKYESIDIWWRGEGQHGNLSLILTRFLTSSRQWRDAKLRLLIVNPKNEDSVMIRQKAEKLLENMRITAEVKVINNQIEQKSFYDLIRIESLKTDLILTGLPDIEDGKEEEFVRETSKLMQDIGTVVLVKASSQFKALQIGLKNTELDEHEERELSFIISKADKQLELTMPDNDRAAKELKELHRQLSDINQNFANTAMSRLLSDNLKLSNLIKNISDKISTDDEFLTIQTLDKFLKDVIAETQKQLTENNTFGAVILKEQIENYIAECRNILLNIPDYQFHTYEKEEFKNNKDDAENAKKIKLKLNNKPVKYKVKFKPLVYNYLPLDAFLMLQELLSKYQLITIQFQTEQQLLLQKFRNTVLAKQIENGNKEKTKEQLSAFKKQVENYTKLEQQTFENLFDFMQTKTDLIIDEIGKNLSRPDVNKLITQKRKKKKELKNLHQQLLEIPDLHAKNQRYFTNFFLLDIYLLDFENRLNRIIKEAITELRVAVNETGYNQAKAITEHLSAYLKKAKQDKNAAFDIRQIAEIPDEENLFAAFKNIFESKFEQLKQNSSELPDELELIEQEAFNILSENPFADFERIIVEPRPLIDYIIQNEIFAPLLRIIDDLPEEVIRQTQAVQNILRLVQFSFFDTDGNILNPEEQTPEKIQEFIHTQLKKSEDLLKDFENVLDENERRIYEHINSLSGKLSTQILTKYADGGLKRSIRTKKVSRLTKTFRTVKKAGSNQINKLWYRHSEAVLLKQRMDVSQDNQSPVKRILDLRETVSPNPETLHDLPFYYRQLFLRAHNYNSEFWFGRKSELNKFKTAVSRYESGLYGGILISGERFSGKTFFVKYAIESCPNLRHSIYVPAPNNAKPDSALFLQNIAKAANINGRGKHIFNRIPKNTVIFIDDFEKWWHKNDNGFAVVNLMTELINEFGNRILFVLTVNNYSLRVINHIKHINKYFLDVIECKPFNAEQLKEIVLFRHKAGGLKLHYRNKDENELSRFDFAKLFAKHFNYSGGNIGITLLAWAANILKFEDDTIYIQSPKMPDISVIDFSDIDIALILNLLMIHGSLNKKHLQELSLLSEKELNEKLAFLMRAGIVEKNIDKRLSINAYMYKSIHDKLKETDII